MPPYFKVVEICVTVLCLSVSVMDIYLFKSACCVSTL